MNLRLNLALLRKYGSPELADRVERDWKKRGLLLPGDDEAGGVGAVADVSTCSASDADPWVCGVHGGTWCGPEAGGTCCMAFARPVEIQQALEKLKAKRHRRAAARASSTTSPRRSDRSHRAPGGQA